MKRELWSESCAARTAEHELRNVNPKDRKPKKKKALKIETKKKNVFEENETKKLIKHSRKKFQPPDCGPDLGGL